MMKNDIGSLFNSLSLLGNTLLFISMGNATGKDDSVWGQNFQQQYILMGIIYILLYLKYFFIFPFGAQRIIFIQITDKKIQIFYLYLNFHLSTILYNMEKNQCYYKEVIAWSRVSSFFGLFVLLVLLINLFNIPTPSHLPRLSQSTRFEFRVS